MKKFLLSLMVMVLVAFTLTACGDEKAYDLYTKMNAAMENISSMEAKVDAKVNMQADGENIDMNMLMDVKEIIHSETDVEMAMLMSIDMGEMGAMDANMYYKDGWMYQEMVGMKAKTALSLDEAMEMVNTDAISALYFDQDAISQSAVKEVAGGTQLSFTLKGDKLSDALDAMAGSMLNSLGGGDDIKMTFSDVSYTILLDANNLPLEQRIIFDMDIEVSGEKIAASYDMNMTDLAYNTIDVIEYPADLDDYVEMNL